MLHEPLSKPEALKLARRILEEGQVVFSYHAAERAETRHLDTTDFQNVIERGFINNEPEQDDRGRWAYRIETYRMVVVVAFRTETELVIVSAWRKP